MRIANILIVLRRVITNSSLRDILMVYDDREGVDLMYWIESSNVRAILLINERVHRHVTVYLILTCCSGCCTIYGTRER